MKNSQITYQGETLESLNKQLAYVNEALSFSLENWERKEFQSVKNDLDFKINATSELINNY